MIKPTSTAAPGPIPTIVPSPIYQTSTQHGQRTLWVVFALMLLSTGLFSLMSWNVPVSRRLFYVLSTLTTLVASLSYFALASGDAITFNCEYVHEHNRHAPDMSHDVCRQVYWARYVDWAITAPLLLVQLSLLAGIDGAHTLMAVVADLVMVLSGLFAALGDAHTAQKWGWYTISCISYVFVLWHVALHGSKAVSAKGRGLSRLFASLSLFALGLWTAYPIVWGIAGGARKTSVDTEIMVYAVLDILAKPIFGLWLLFSQRKVAESNVEVTGYWSHGPAGEGRIRIGEDE